MNTNLKIAKKYFKEHSTAINGNWCFWERDTEPKFNNFIKFKGKYYEVTYQIGSGYDFMIYKENDKLQEVL